MNGGTSEYNEYDERKKETRRKEQEERGGKSVLKDRER